MKNIFLAIVFILFSCSSSFAGLKAVTNYGSTPGSGGGSQTFLGTSITTNNPQRSGEPGTGLSTATTGTVLLNCGAVIIATFNTLGVGIFSTPVNALDVNGGVAIGSSYAGAVTAPANGISVQGSIAMGLGTSAPDGTITMSGLADQTIDVGTAASGAGAALVLRAGSAAAGSTNQQPGRLSLRGGIGTGNASTSVAIAFQAYAPVASGTSAQTLFNMANFDNSGDFFISPSNTGYSPSLGSNFGAFLVSSNVRQKTHINSVNWVSDTSSGAFNCAKSRGGVIGTPSVITTGDNTCQFAGWGYDGTGWSENADMLFGTEGTIAAGSVPGTIALRTATSGGTITTALKINSAQLLTLPAITSDATHTDASVCEDTTTHGLYSGSGTLGICLGTSSKRYKKDIYPLDEGLAELMRLNPVSFFYRQGYGDNGVKVNWGFLAEDTENVLPALTGLDKDGKPNSVDLLGMMPLVIHAVQQQQDELSQLGAIPRKCNKFCKAIQYLGSI